MTLRSDIICTNNNMTKYTGFVNRLYSVDIMTSELAQQKKILYEFSDIYVEGINILQFIKKMPYVSSFVILYFNTRMNRLSLLCRKIAQRVNHAQEYNIKQSLHYS